MNNCKKKIRCLNMIMTYKSREEIIEFLEAESQILAFLNVGSLYSSPI